MAKSSQKKRYQNTAGDKTRETMLKVAASLFAERGYEGVSTRDITTAAEVNQAALYYHFGTKRELFMGCVLGCFDYIAKERLMLLAKAEAKQDCALEDILEAFIAPHVNYVTRPEGADYLRIFTTFPSLPSDIRDELYTEHFAPVRFKFLDALRRQLPGIEEDNLHRAFSFLAEMLVSALFDTGYKATSGQKPSQIEVEAFIGLMIKFTAAGMRALQIAKD